MKRSESPTPKRQSNSLLTSRRIADIRALVALQSNNCSIFLGEDGEDSEQVTVEIKPYLDLFIHEPVCFEIKIPSNYPTQAPEVLCKTDVSKYKEVTEVNLDSGEVKLSILDQGEAGWSRIYNLVIVYYSIRLLFKDRLNRWNHGKVIGKHSAWTNGTPQIRHKTLSGDAAGGGTPRDNEERSQNSPQGLGDSAGGLPAPESEGLRFQLLATHHGEQGIRRTMEDAYTIELNLTVPIQGKQRSDVGVVCLMDGHGGHLCADYSSERLSGILCTHLEAGMGCRQALWQGIQDVDGDFRKEYDSAERVGCTCLALLFDGRRHCYIGNLGDCRAVLYRGRRALDMTRDTRADRPDEVARISAAGGFVANGRVNGKLAVSRALGDFMYKHHYHRSRLVGSATVVSSEPELSEVELSEEDQFIIIACDGLWDVMSSEEAVAFVATRLSEGQSTKEITEALVKSAIEELDSTDNVSAIVIQIGVRDGPCSLENSAMGSTFGSLLNSPTLHGLLARDGDKDLMKLDSFNDDDEINASSHKPINKTSHKLSGAKHSSDGTNRFSSRGMQPRAESKGKSIDDLNDDEFFDYLLDEKNFS